MNTSGAVVSQPWLLTMRTKTESKKRGIIGLQSDDPSERQEIAPPTLTNMLCVVYHGRHLLKEERRFFHGRITGTARRGALQSIHEP